MRAPAPFAPPVLPKISARFSRRDLLLVRPILSKVWYATRPSGSELPWVQPSPTDFVDQVGVRIPEEVWEKRIEQLGEYLRSSPEALYPRVRLDVLDLCLCQLALRTLFKQVRHKHLPEPRCSDYVRAGKQFLRVLENLRKRARTAAVNAVGKEKYVWLTTQWRRYARILRIYAIDCRCGKPLDPGRYNSSRFYLDKIVKIAEQDLRDENILIPDPKILRRWAQLLLHNVRRHREGTITTRDLVESLAGRSCIRFFMRRKVWVTFGKRTDRIF